MAVSVAVWVTGSTYRLRFESESHNKTTKVHHILLDGICDMSSRTVDVVKAKSLRRNGLAFDYSLMCSRLVCIHAGSDRGKGQLFSCGL